MKNSGLIVILIALTMAFGSVSASGQSIRLTTPNGGERLALGDSVMITWETVDFAENIRLILYKGGTDSTHRVGIIVDSYPAVSGSYPWTVGALTGMTASPGEDFYIRIRGADIGGIFDYSDAPFAIFSTAPNIRCESMHAIGWDHTFIPRTFTAGDTVTIKYHLVNNSPYPAGAFNVGLRVGGAIIDRQAVTSLVNGAEHAGEFSWIATCGAPVDVMADCDNAISESDESDNLMTDPGLTCSEPNLVLWNTTFSGTDPTSAKAGLRYRFYAQVRADTATARDVVIKGGVVGGAVLLNTTVPVMSPGDNESVDFIWEVPEGTHRVFFQVDPRNTIAESNESDNRWVLDVTGVVSTPADEHYDLSLRLLNRPRPSSSRIIPTVEINKPVTIKGEIRGATGAIRSVVITAHLARKGDPPVRIHQTTIYPISSLVVPFSFPWTPTKLGEQKITVRVEPGAHAVAVGVVDANPSNNYASQVVKVIRKSTIFKPRAIKR